MASIRDKFVVSTDGTKIWAEGVGDQSKPAIVFLHGFAFSAVAFEKQFTDLTLRENLHMVEPLKIWSFLCFGILTRLNRSDMTFAAMVAVTSLLQLMHILPNAWRRISRPSVKLSASPDHS